MISMMACPIRATPRCATVMILYRIDGYTIRIRRFVGLAHGCAPTAIPHRRQSPATWYPEDFMNGDPNAHLTPDFIQKQRARLIAMRDELVRAGDEAAGEERVLQDASGGEPQDSGDDAERFAIQENDEAVLYRNEQRVITIERALQKIEEGTYGLSDGSGDPIPQARLELVPETIYTMEEEEDRERRR
jgi:DnaK suppressor protein